MFNTIGIFLRLGVLGFGGPFALIAMMETEFVEKRKWISAEQFSQAFAVIKVFPGATATQLAIYIAQHRAGRIMGLICGLAFLLPSVIFVLVLSVFYAKAREVAQMSDLFQGMQIGALVVIADSVVRMARPYWNSRRAMIIALISGAVILWNAGLEPFLILAFGLAGVARIGQRMGMLGIVALPGALAFAPASDLFKLTLTCLKAGFLVFGTGLAIIPVLEADIVGKHHWLTHAEFLDGLAIGQITPGPVSTTATFIGYRVAGYSGAFCATAAIFASAFINILILLPILEARLRSSPRLKDFTDWAFPAVIGGIVATSFKLGVATVNTWLLGVSLIAFGIILFKWRPPAWALIPLSGCVIFAVGKLM